MTSFEHALLGVNGVLAVGLHRTYGWQLAAIAGIAATLPDWDGLTILFSTQLFNESHRAWGHNVFSCLLLGLLVGGLDYCQDSVTRGARGLARPSRIEIPPASLGVRHDFSMSGLRVWLIVAILAALSHLPADLVVSGTATLGDWELKLFWPLSDRGYVFPCVRWGDAMISILFVAGMLAMVRWRTHTHVIAALTLLSVVGYVVVRCLMGY
jgi:hypothetical protein